MNIPEELLVEFEKGSVLLILGHSINTGSRSSPADLVEELVGLAQYPEAERLSLDRVAQYYELKRSRNDLITFLKDRLDASRPTQLHHCVMDLTHAVKEHPVTEVITLCYDDLLEQVLREHQIPCTSITRKEDIPFSKEYQVLVVHLWGRHDQPDSLVITRDDKSVFSNQSGSLYSWICGDLAQRTWLCLGVDLEDEWFQQLYVQVFAPLGKYGRRAYACGTAVGEVGHLWWQKRNMHIFPLDISIFLSELVGQLHARPVQRDIALQTATYAATLPAPPDEPLERLPYKELRYYEREDEALFFGREADKHYLLQQILANRLTILTAPSGAGKSSLLNAGVVPRLEREGFVVGTARLIGDPLARLVNEGIRPLLPQKLSAPPEVKLAGYLLSACEVLEKQIVLIIDQFEEFFARPLARQTRLEFLAELVSVVIDRSLPVRIVLSLRSDWVHALRVFDDWFPDALNYEVRIKRLDIEQARQAITGPLNLLGISYEEQLVDEVVSDLLQEVREGAISQDDTFTQALVDPPQLQLVCHALYAARAQEELDLRTYQEIGRAKGILQGYLRRKLEMFGTEQALARRILEALVTPWDTKAARTLKEIQVEVSEGSATVERVLDRLIDDRLVRRDTREGDVYYELAHEYLVDEINLTEEMRSLKRAEHWLSQGVEEWTLGRTLLGRDQFRAINQERERIRPRLCEWSEETRALLLRCALQYDLDIAYWLDQVDTSDVKKTILLEVLQGSEDPKSRTKAASTLKPLLDTEVEDVLLEAALSDESLSARQAAAESLQGCSEQARQRLLKEARTGSRLRMIRALEALGYAGMSDDVPDLMRIAAERDVEKRSAAIGALDRVYTGFSLRWLWVRNRDMLLGDTAIFLTTLLVLVVGLHYFVIAALGTGTAWLTSPFRQAVLRNTLILSYKLQWVFVFPLTLVALAFVLVGYVWYRAIRRGLALLLLMLVCTTGVTNGFYRPYEMYIARTKPAQVYNRAEYELVNAENLPMARRLFGEIYPYSKEKVLIDAWLAGINYLEGDYVQAVRESCVWLAYDSSVTPDYDTIASSLVTTVHWSLYQLAHTMSFDKALAWRDQLLQEIAESQPNSHCVVDAELSPVFFGISPDNRAFMMELSQKYAPPTLYTYLGILSGHPERYPLPEGAIVDDIDREILSSLVSAPSYGDSYWDDQGMRHERDRYAYWAAFLIGDYGHPAIYNINEWRVPESRIREQKNVAAAALFAQAVSNLGSEPALGIARISVHLDPSDRYMEYLEDSPWLDDLYALLMYLWSQQGDTDRALDYYSKLSQLKEYDVLCDFCNPWSVLGLSMSTAELQTLVVDQDPRISMTACEPPYFLDLLGLKQLVGKQYDDARATFRQLGERCKARYPGIDAYDYLRVVSLLEAISESPTKENYQRYFKIMDQSWTWDYQGEVPSPKTWFLQNTVYRTNNWPVEVFVQINPWMTYARLLEDYADRFAQDAESDVRIPASLLQAAWLYDVLAARPGEKLNQDAQEAYTRQLQARAVAALERYLELYFERDDVPPEFCRYYRKNDDYPSRYHVVQDCAIEWLALLHLGVHRGEDTSERYDERDIVAMQEQARTLVERYPAHHLANNLLNWIAWGYCYSANLYPAYSGAYVENYRSALHTYQELLDRYPAGAQAANARENIRIIEEKLRSPEARRLVPEGRWTWDVAEKPAPQLEDFLK